MKVNKKKGGNNVVFSLIIKKSHWGKAVEDNQ